MEQSVARPCRSCRTPAGVVEPLEGRLLLHGGHLHGPPVPLAPVAALAPGETFHLRINAGGKAYVAADGHTWERDRYGRGGGRGGKRYDVAGTVDDRLFSQARSGRSLRYAIPVTPGAYTVNLLFADPKFTTAGRRQFDVKAEDQPLLSNFDIAANGGGRSAIVQSFPVTVADESLDLAFHRVVNKAIVSAIEVVQSAPAAPAVPASTWLTGASAPVTLFEAQAAAVADRVYVFGGFNNLNVHATRAVNVYDTLTDTWAPRSEMPSPVTHGAVAVDGATVWLLGGLLGDYAGGENLPAKDTWRYDMATDVWAPGPPLPAATGAGGAALVGRKLHYFGGFAPDGQSDSSNHYVLDLDALAADPTTTWSYAKAMPAARNHFGTAVVGGKVYAIGGQHGRDETNRNLADVHVYDPATDGWSFATPLPVPMSHFHNSTAVVNDRILVAGGVTNGRTPLSDVWEYDPATNTWAASDAMPAPRKAPVAVLAAGRLYVLTGSPGDNFPQSDVWFRGI